MSYWNKSLKRDLLTNRTNTLLADLTSEMEKLSAAELAFGNLAAQALSNSASINVIRSIAFKYKSVVNGFKTAAEYDAIDCRTLLGYIGEEEEDLIFGELYGNWEVAKQNRDNTQSELDTYKRDSTYTTSYTDYDALGNEITITENHYPDPYVVSCYEQSIDGYQAEMDAWQAKLDRLGEFEDRSGALFTNSASFRTNATTALNELLDCVSENGTFRDAESNAVDVLDQLHTQRQEDYYDQWFDESGNPDWDAIDDFLYQDPANVPWDQKVAFCSFMDGLSDEQMTELMNHATRVNYDSETMTYTNEVSEVMEQVADLNAALWCARYKLADYTVAGFDENAMNRAIAIKYAVKTLKDMAIEENGYMDPIYDKHLVVYVDGSNVYIIPRMTLDDEYYYSDDPDEGAMLIFQHIIQRDIDFWTNYLEDYTLVSVNNDDTSISQLCDSVGNILIQISGGDPSEFNLAGEIGTEAFYYLLGKFVDVVGFGVVSEFIDFAMFIGDIEDQLSNMTAGQNGIQQIDKIKICDALCLQYFSGASVNGTLVGAENLQYNIGELQLRLAAYNQNNDRRCYDIDINWILNPGSLTQGQRDAVGNFVYWYHNCQSGVHYIDDFKNDFEEQYDAMKDDFNITGAPRYDDLNPAQFQEVMNYWEDPNYEVNADLFE